MKRLLTLTIALCIICLCCTAAAETRLKTESAPLETEDFTLTLGEGTFYIPGEKIANDILLKVYPFSTSGDNKTNIQFFWYGRQFSTSVEQIRKYWINEDYYVWTSLLNSGHKINEFKSSNARESVLCGKSVIIIDHKLIENYQIVQLQTIYFPDQGYELTLSAKTTETLDQMLELLDTALVWA